MGKISTNMVDKKAYSAGPSRNLMDPSLTQNHMTSHYNKILSAKASVDCSVPKSMLLSVKYKDQLKKKNLQTKYQRGLISARSESWSSSGSSGSLTVTESIQNPSVLEHNKDVSMTPERTFITSKENFSMLPSTANISKETTPKTFSRCYSDLSSRISASPRQRSRTFYSSTTSLANSQRCYNSFQDVRQKTYSGDILDKHAHHFTNGQQFTPRILKKEAQSSLAHFRYYTPVKKKKLSKKKLVTQETQTEFTSSQVASSLKNKKDRSHLASLQAVYNNQVCSDDEREERDVLSQNSQCEELQECFQCTYDYPVQRLSSSNRIKSPIMKRVKAEEEELKYLVFISDITSEILTRGLFSNRVLERIFERRIEENRHRLDEQKLRHLLDELKEDLGCKPEKDWRTNACETVLTKTKMIELNNCVSLENPRFSHNWREEADRTENFSINNENDKLWDHRLQENFSEGNDSDLNLTRNTSPHDSCGEQIQEVQDLEENHRPVANSEENHDDLQSADHSDCSTDYSTFFDGAAELTEIDDLAVSLHTVDVKENCEAEDVQSGSALSKMSKQAFDDGIDL
ncbi:hypothetical protein scyTo_0007656 [Scyliorhinus torazame]|uniref:Spermatogenesis-associated protein 7 n=1 Tax=Scyliorhinus torazame TaxID=75743 RepID=A0A401NW83_SCYTO|nr:hypothetical protein [Scyliorhinus torazame]